MGSQSFKLGIVLTFLLLLPFYAQAAKKKNPKVENYIEQYKAIAIQEMKLYKIPASITLAQGILESGSGLSTLAKKSNNHFGIKCGKSWKGKKTYHDDDAKGECFRVYRNATESYRDHSLFLANGTRYAFLFKLDIKDYKGWARGLKKAGYATNPSYANILISLIEDYELYKYDSGKYKGSSKVAATSKSNRKWFRVRKSRKAAEKEMALKPIVAHQVFLNNDLAYIVARSGDTFEDINREFGISAKKLIKYNDLHAGYTLEAGDIVYLKTKRKKSLTKSIYKVKSGDSMHTISQIVGIKLSNLYRMNKKDPDYMPKVGDVLRVR